MKKGNINQCVLALPQLVLCHFPMNTLTARNSSKDILKPLTLFDRHTKRRQLSLDFRH